MYDPRRARGSRDVSARWTVTISSLTGIVGCKLEARWDIKSDFPEEGGEDRRIGKRRERCAAISRRAAIAEGVAMISEGEGMVTDDLSINKPWIFTIQGLAEGLDS
jgi:hypothetical protein